MDGQNNEWQAPPIPEQIHAQQETPEMSEAATLGNVFIEPGRTFEDLRRKPRFILAALAIIAVTTIFQFMFISKVGEDNLRRYIGEQIDKSPQAASLSREQKEQSIDLQLTIVKATRYLMPLFIIIGLVIGGLLYWGLANAFGGRANFLHGLSAWVYSSLPPTLVLMLANIIVVLFKSPDDIDIGASQRGLVQANPSLLVDGKEMPVVATLLSTLDLFAIWGWVLAAIALQKMARLSAGAAWAIVILMALVGLTFRVVMSLINGAPM